MEGGVVCPPLHQGGPGTVAEEHTGAPVAKVHDPAEDFRPQYQAVLPGGGGQQALGGVQSVHKAGAGGVQIKAYGILRKAQLLLEQAGGGTILNVASSAGLLPGGPYMAGYYASKAYVVSLTRGAAQELREKRSPVYVCALCPGPVNTEFNDRAGVVFALKGITPEFCVDEAIHGMLHHKTIIVPSAFMRLCTSAQKLLPTPLLMPIVARQQKKKLG